MNKKNTNTKRQQRKQHNHLNDMFVYWTGRLAVALSLVHVWPCAVCTFWDSVSGVRLARIFSSLSLNFGSFIHFEIHRILKWLMYAARQYRDNRNSTTTINQIQFVSDFSFRVLFFFLLRSFDLFDKLLCMIAWIEGSNKWKWNENGKKVWKFLFEIKTREKWWNRYEWIKFQFHLHRWQNNSWRDHKNKI